MADVPQLAGAASISLRLPRVRVATLAAATFCLTVFTFSLSRHLVAPFGFDHALYQYIADRVIAGQRMYADLYDHNAPGIIGIHWLATRLFGSSQMSIRLLDACWQGLTIAAFVLLAGRDGNRWQVGWTAATLYVLAFYGFASTNTAEREGFAVLPLLLAIHAMTDAPAERLEHSGRRFARYAFAGLCGLIIVTIKPPLGLCYGLLWIMTLVEAWQLRREGLRALVAIAGLTAGFLLAAGGAVLLLMKLDWWNAYLPMLTGAEFPEGYVIGPGMIRLLLPYVAAAAVVIAAWIGWQHIGSATRNGARRQIPLSEAVQAAAVGILVFGLLLTTSSWKAWGDRIVAVAGVVLPACVAVAVVPWSDRSRTWRMCTLLCGAALMALFLQGRFTPYRLAVFLAMASYPAACEIATGVAAASRMTRHRQMRAVVGVACVLHLLAGHWWLGMTAHGSPPFPPSGQPLEAHYAKVNNASRVTVRYETVVAAARRIRELTCPTDPITMLFYDPRIYYMARRPPIHRVIIPMDVNRAQYGAFMAGIETGRPKLLVARIPAAVRNETDFVIIERAVFADAEERFGPQATTLCQLYVVRETVGDIAILVEQAE